MVKFWPAGLACEKIIFNMHAIKKVKKGTYDEIQNDCQNMFNFYDSLCGLWVRGLPILMFVIVAVKPKCTHRVFQARFLILH